MVAICITILNVIGNSTLDVKKQTLRIQITTHNYVPSDLLFSNHSDNDSVQPCADADPNDSGLPIGCFQDEPAPRSKFIYAMNLSCGV